MAKIETVERKGAYELAHYMLAGWLVVGPKRDGTRDVLINGKFNDVFPKYKELAGDDDT